MLVCGRCGLGLRGRVRLNRRPRLLSLCHFSFPPLFCSDAISDLALHFLAKMKILVLRDIERDEVEFVCKSLGCRPVAHIDSLTPDMLGHADLVEEVSAGDSKIVQVGGDRAAHVDPVVFFLPHLRTFQRRSFLSLNLRVLLCHLSPNQITGAEKRGKTVSIVVRGSSKLVVAEAERSIHDALCVIRCLVKKPFLIAGGGAPEIEVALRLAERSQALTGSEAYCVRAFAEAMEVCVPACDFEAVKEEKHRVSAQPRPPGLFYLGIGCAVYVGGERRPEPHFHRYGPARASPGGRAQHGHQRPQGVSS